MMLAHLQLEDYWIDELVLRDIGGSAPASVAEDRVPLPRVEFEVITPEAEEEEAERYHVILVTVSAGKAKALKGIPYEFRIQVYGIFTVSPQLDEESQYRLLHLNGPAMLYGIARSAIGTVTALGRKDKYILPSINILDIFKRQQRRKLARRQPEAPAS